MSANPNPPQFLNRYQLAVKIHVPAHQVYDASKSGQLIPDGFLDATPIFLVDRLPELARIFQQPGTVEA